MSLNYKNHVPAILSSISFLKIFSLDPLDPSFGDRPAADLSVRVFTAHRPLQKVTKFKLALLPAHRLLC